MAAMGDSKICSRAIGVIGDRRKPKFGVIGDRRRRTGEAKNPAAEKKRTFMLSNVPFELDAKYAPVKVLGMGGYGVVCSCLNRDTGDYVAVKKIPDALGHRDTAIKTLREIQILRKIRHENVISLKDVMLSSSVAGKEDYHHVYVVQDLMDFDLLRVLRSRKLSGVHCKYLLFQILRGLKFLHSADVIHRDLKPENLLLKANFDLKICDFGLARTKYDDAQSMTEYTTTRWYRAPEILYGANWYGNSIDIWSAGCVFAEMLTGLPIFPGSNAISQIREIHRVLGTQDLRLIKCERTRKHLEEEVPYSPGLSFESLYPLADPLAIDLLKKMLVFDPWKRISASEALEHPYFSGLYDPLLEPLTPSSVRLEVDEYPHLVGHKMLREAIWEEMLLFHPEERSVFYRRLSHSG